MKHFGDVLLFFFKMFCDRCELYANVVPMYSGLRPDWHGRDIRGKSATSLPSSRLGLVRVPIWVDTFLWEGQSIFSRVKSRDGESRIPRMTSRMLLSSKFKLKL